MQKYYCGIVTPVDDPSWVPDHVNFYVYKTDEVDAHIEALESAAVASALRVKELEKALQEIAQFKPGTFWSLQDEIKINETASNALMETATK